jgi:uncharacterized protein (DUF1800 family)
MKVWASITAVALAAASPLAVASVHDHVFGNKFEVITDLPASTNEAARFLTQATFGPTTADVNRLMQIGYSEWIDEQIGLPATLEYNTVETVKNAHAGGASQSYRLNRWFWQAVYAPDQLRQRMAFALSQIFVVSDQSSAISGDNVPMSAYQDMLAKDSFGYYSTLLNDVTYSPTMGKFLNAYHNVAPICSGSGPTLVCTTSPDENYAREVMQLFTIGLWQLNDDGSQKLDGSGNPIPTYSNNDVQGLAKVFTGFSWNVPGDNSDGVWTNCCIYVGPGYGEDLRPMQAFPSHHSQLEKQFLGVDIPAGSSDPSADLKIALDTLFNHPNLPAFFSKQMIEHMVTSNPSPAYINRVAQIFKDDGTGVRGNMQAVLTAILTDPEARDTATDVANPQFGKVREALIRYTEWARAFTAQSRTGSYNTGSTEDPIYGLGEMTLRSPSVFNWFAPGYVPPNTSISAAGLEAPEMQMTNVSSVVGYINYMQTSIGATATAGPDMFSSYATEMSLAATPDQLLDRINLMLMAGQMNSTLYSQILAAINSIPIPPGSQSAVNAALLERVQTAIYLTMASPDYCAQQ